MVGVCGTGSASFAQTYITGRVQSNPINHLATDRFIMKFSIRVTGYLPERMPPVDYGPSFALARQHGLESSATTKDWKWPYPMHSIIREFVIDS